MWSITSYYNPIRYRRRLQNYRIFRQNLASPLLTVELSFDGAFELAKPDADILIQISGGAVLWQKERLLNVAIKAVPADGNYIAWVDCDAIFDRPDWARQAEAQLATHNIVQLYSDLVDLGPATHDYRSAAATAHGIVSVVSETGAAVAPSLARGSAAGGYAMGLAWAARRDILQQYGLYDAMVLGSGDRLLVGTLYGEFQKVIDVFEFNPARQRHYLNWARPFREAMAGRVGYLPGRIYHLWHGDFAKRNTIGRHRSLARTDFDPERDLTVGTNGAWHWARPRPDLEALFRNYFRDRAEDDEEEQSP